jgi:Tol biopolymer transport system component
MKTLYATLFTKPTFKFGGRLPIGIWVLIVGSGFALLWLIVDWITFRPSGMIAYECQHRGDKNPFYRDICLFQFSNNRSDTLINLDARLLSPTWSADGEHLAFIRIDGGYTAIMIYDYGLRQIKTLWQTDYLSQDSVSLLTWLPNQERILFQGKLNNKGGLYSLDTSQSNPTPRLFVSTGFSTLNDPVFSSANNRIYYYDGDDDQLFSVDLDGSDKQVANIECGDPAFAPDGQRLACSGVNESIQYKLPKWQRLSVKHIFLVLSIAAEPTWSPDGQYIVYRQTHWPTFMGNHNGELWIMRADGSHPVKLTNGPADRNPAWRPQP